MKASALASSHGGGAMHDRSRKSGGETGRADCGQESAPAQLATCHLVQKNLYRFAGITHLGASLGWGDAGGPRYSWFAKLEAPASEGLILLSDAIDAPLASAREDEIEEGEAK